MTKLKGYLKHIEVSEFRAILPLQSLVNHATERLRESLNLNSRDFKGFLKLDIHLRWGCDSGHSGYHQKVNELTNGTIVFWENRKSTSTCYCRPYYLLYNSRKTNIKFNNEKDTIDLIKHELK